MILSNREICRALADNKFSIRSLAGEDPSKAPFNTSAVDLRLADEISICDKKVPVSLDLRKPGIAGFLAANSTVMKITEAQPYTLVPNKLILAKTIEVVSFPLLSGQFTYSARVEGKSSLARCGILVHFTAPTIHAGFNGTITLEIINLGPIDFLMYPGMFICQLIIEEVKGEPADAPNQFKGQNTAAGLKA
jgi:dCTP deaminase